MQFMDREALKKASNRFHYISIQNQSKLPVNFELSIDSYKETVNNQN